MNTLIEDTNLCTSSTSISITGTVLCIVLTVYKCVCKKQRRKKRPDFHVASQKTTKHYNNSFILKSILSSKKKLYAHFVLSDFLSLTFSIHKNQFNYTRYSNVTFRNGNSYNSNENQIEMEQIAFLCA